MFIDFWIWIEGSKIILAGSEIGTLIFVWLKAVFTSIYGVMISKHKRVV